MYKKFLHYIAKIRYFSTVKNAGKSNTVKWLYIAYQKVFLLVTLEKQK